MGSEPSIAARVKAIVLRGCARLHLRHILVDPELAERLHALAERETRPAQEFAQELLARGIQEHQRAQLTRLRWASLTPRQQQVACALSSQFTYTQIAGQLFIGEQTVKTHARVIFKKLGVSSRDELRACLARCGIDSPLRSSQ